MGKTSPGRSTPTSRVLWRFVAISNRARPGLESNLPPDPTPDYAESLTQMDGTASAFESSPLAFLDGLRAREVRTNETQNFRQDVDDVLQQLDPDATASQPFDAKVRMLKALLEDPELQEFFLLIQRGGVEGVPLQEILPKSPKCQVLDVGPTNTDNLLEPLSTNTFHIGATAHLTFPDSEELPFQHVKHIRARESISVQEVRTSKSSTGLKGYAGTYALNIQRMNKHSQTAKIMERLMAEAEIQKHLRHEHIIRLAFSFRHERDIGFMLTPLASSIHPSRQISPWHLISFRLAALL
ncbi:hypothetical protein BCR34DRAFT_593477 [Clohesyomyces aquaticus]|uniref:Protein kinase domain-containing protein n=1 Tax=Clohesyomyces aquaticus TaxID=1231657 RepID=A0A1Y1YI10_9PLEO|nr:hypothetical protein BCR34DRAFT_593477 [Clohesyomyces aquaticus]